MTKGNDNAQQEALEALIAASLRSAGTPPDITEEDIKRYVEQHVTLSSEDEAALEKAKPSLMRAIKDILHGRKQEEACCARPLTAGHVKHSASLTHKRATDEFVEAVVIAQLTRQIATPDFPLGRMRYNKLAYLSHRKADEDVAEHYLKKAAGPYSPWAKYQGPETIALRNGYVKRAKTGNFEGLVVGDQIGKIDEYLSRYPVCAALNWVVGQFRYRKNDELELLTTVDFAALDLIRQGVSPTMESVKHVIAANKEWKPKLNRVIFSDQKISQALAELRDLFPRTYA